MTMTAERNMTCAACGSRKATRAFRALGLRIADPDFWLVVCRCGLGWTEPSLPDEEMGAYYPPAYYGKENVRFNPLIEKLVRIFRRRRAAVVRRWTTPGPVVDVGCGRGFILKNLERLGFEPLGIELSDSAAWHARHKLGIPVHVGDFGRAPIQAGTFHAAIFWHSLEHHRRPVEAIEKAHRILKRGGLLVVAVPNLDSFQARLFGSSWFHLDIPRHYFHFGLHSLQKVVEDAGFRVVQVDHFSFEQNPYGWLQSFYNRLGFEFNFLYSILKNQTSRVVPIRKHPYQALIILATLPLLVPLSIVLTFLEAGLRRGGTIELYAVKK